ncbi:hypothetical protein ACIBM3_10345 [Rhodococcus erythropolis]|uniref:hypothetical protein n=1 Tax=Rhodococcus erythropolis TaxID=1833 RepID=UPI0037AD14B5
MTEKSVMHPRSDAMYPLALASILRSAFATEATTQLGIHLSRRKGHYDKLPQSHRYDPTYTSSAMTRGIDLGVTLGLLAEVRGSAQVPGPEKRVSVETQVALSEKALHLLNGLLSPFEAPELAQHAPFVEVRDRRTHKEIDFTVTEWSRRVEAEMVDLDAVQRTQSLTLDGAILPNSRLVRKFSGSLNSGGRAYSMGPGTWQTLRASTRKRLKIDGEITADLDMRNLHLRLALHQAGQPITSDVDLYSDIPRADGRGTCDRDVIKIVCAAALSGQNRAQVAHSLAAQLFEAPSPTAQVKSENPRRPQDLYPFVQTVIDSLTAQYPAIREMLFTDAGVKLQRIDSDLMHEIRLAVYARTGIAGYPVHDSLIIPARMASTCHDVMGGILAKHKYPIPLKITMPSV